MTCIFEGADPELVEHKDMFGVPDSKTDLQLMPLSEYGNW
jgi:hypothetical protein